MNIKELKVDITLNRREVDDIAFSLHQSLKSQVETHYKHHPLSLFVEQEKRSIELMKSFFSLVGNGRIAHHYIDDLEKIITEAQKAKN